MSTERRRRRNTSLILMASAYGLFVGLSRLVAELYDTDDRVRAGEELVRALVDAEVLKYADDESHKTTTEGGET